MLKDNLCLLLGQTARVISNELSDQFRKEGYQVTTEQWVALAILWKKDGISQHELAQRSFKNKATINNMVTNLENSGCIKRTADAKDKRTNHIVLTDLGKYLETPLSKIAENVLKKSLKGIEAAQLDSAIALLKSVITNLGADPFH